MALFMRVRALMAVRGEIMIDVKIALMLHVLGVIWWIGGLAFVCAVVLPELRSHPDNLIDRFHAIEGRFAPQVRAAILLVGMTGGWLLYRTGYWALLGSLQFWWLNAMIGFWTLFFLMLFIFGPTGVLRRVMSGPLDRDVVVRFKRLHWLHWVLLVLGLVVVLGAIAGNHGLG